MKKIRLYDYQSQMLRCICKTLKEPSTKSVMVQMPTGTGKTYVMAAAIQHLKVDGEIWVVAHRRELVEQMEDTLERFGIPNDEYNSTRLPAKLHKNCNYTAPSNTTRKDFTPAKNPAKPKVKVMSIQWLARHITQIQADVTTSPALIIIDEAHHSIAPSYQLMWTAFPQAMKLGFTATPCRLKPAPFHTLYDTLLTSWSIHRFISEGRLSLYDYVATSRNSADQHTVDSLARRGADGDYSTAEMEEKLDVDPAIARLYNSVDRYAHGRKGIVYAISIAHARHIVDYYTSRGLKAVAIDSKTPTEERKRLVDDFRCGTVDCLVNVNLFDEGFDCPDVEYIQMARPTLSLSKYLQMVGRGLRVHPHKRMCVLIDNVGLYRMFGLPDADRDWTGTFHGEAAGKGKPVKNRRANLLRLDNEMEVVVNHSRLLPQTEDEERIFRQSTEPFEKGGRWGLKSGTSIILPPVYKMIGAFVGDYCPYSIAEGRWGILSRKGLVVIKPDFKEVHILNDGTALLKVNDFFTKTIQLAIAEREAVEDRIWWKQHKRIIKELTEEKKHPLQG